MIYEPLLLNAGGGIIPENARSPQFRHAAALCIGIGGTGIDALCDLKSKIYGHLIPDNPDEPFSKYEGIQLLGIDSDDYSFKNPGGIHRLNDEESFSIVYPGPPGTFAHSAGGVRQVGHHLLVRKAASLYQKIHVKCSIALQQRCCKDLDVFVFAGLSGGTGSGCFLDVCYLLRKVAEDNDWNIQIVGCFFMPDVVTSKATVACQRSCVQYNNSNGYAALKELDYLMQLEPANDWFDQNYGAGIRVHTQRPPVDGCNLISVVKADGTWIANGYRYSINLASDYVLKFLSGHSGAVMRNHMSNVQMGMRTIHKHHGVNLAYSILGASCAQLPRTQINTYLATGFFKRFRKLVYKPRPDITQDDVNRCLESLHITLNHVYEDVVRDKPELILSHFPSPKALAAMGPLPKNALPDTWAAEGNNWMIACEGNSNRNVANLTRDLKDFSHENINEQALIGRLFRKLWDLSMDPNYGPYYAAALLHNSGNYDILTALEDEISTAHRYDQQQKIQVPAILDNLADFSHELSHKLLKKRIYYQYYQETERYFLTVSHANECVMVARVLTAFRQQAETLYSSFFRPLCDLLDNLMETFQENESYLKLPEAREPNAYTWQILTLDDVKGRLDNAIDVLDKQQIVTHFIQHILDHSDTWIPGRHYDPNGISRLICNYMMSGPFRTELERSLQDYLLVAFPEAHGNQTLLAHPVKDNILQKVISQSIPKFWCDPTYDITTPLLTISSRTLFIPGDCPAVRQAASQFTVANPGCVLTETNGDEQIFMLHQISGLPLFAYCGLMNLRSEYGGCLRSVVGAGSHLYSQTGRAAEGCADVDWRSYLPEPIPYSKVAGTPQEYLCPNGKEISALYYNAVAQGVIGTLPSDYSWLTEWAIFRTPDLQVKDYAPEDFLDGDTFLQAAYDEELRKIRDQIRTLHAYGENADITPVQLRDDGTPDECDPEAVRIDYFIQYRPLQKIVRDELRKIQLLKDAEAALIGIAANRQQA